jgi:hypothetical protein
VVPAFVEAPGGVATAAAVVEAAGVPLAGVLTILRWMTEVRKSVVSLRPAPGPSGTLGEANEFMRKMSSSCPSFVPFLIGQFSSLRNLARGEGYWG